MGSPRDEGDSGSELASGRARRARSARLTELTVRRPTPPTSMRWSSSATHSSAPSSASRASAARSSRTSGGSSISTGTPGSSTPRAAWRATRRSRSAARAATCPTATSIPSSAAGAPAACWSISPRRGRVSSGRSPSRTRSSRSTKPRPELLGSRGYRPVRHFYRMSIELGDDRASARVARRPSRRAVRRRRRARLPRGDRGRLAGSLGLQPPTVRAVPGAPARGLPVRPEPVDRGVGGRRDRRRDDLRGRSCTTWAGFGRSRCAGPGDGTASGWPCC